VKVGRQNLKNLKIVVLVIAIVLVLIFFFVLIPYLFPSGSILGGRSGRPPFPFTPDPSQAPFIPK
jgi:hypothetical protein